MSISAIFWHVIGSLWPVLVLSTLLTGGLALVRGVRNWRVAGRRWAGMVAAGVAVYWGVGWWSGQDGRMLTYLLLVLVLASQAWWWSRTPPDKPPVPVGVRARRERPRRSRP